MLIRKNIQKRDENEIFDLNSKDLFKITISLFKQDIIICILFFLLESCLRLAISILFQKLLTQVSNENKSSAYIYASFICLAFFASQICGNNGFYRTSILSAKIRAAYIQVAFVKLSSLSQYTAKTLDVGKIINLFSNDFNLIQLKFSLGFSSIVFPFGFIGITIILWFIIGWPMFVGLSIPVILLPLQTFVSKHNGQLLQKVNKDKDERVKTCTQIIQGIKFIKFYGWDIQKIRQNQIKTYIWLGLGRGIQRALGHCISIWVGLLIFITAYYGTDYLSTIIIISTLQILMYLQLLMYNSSLGIGFFYELQIMIERFSQIINIKNIQMVQIDVFTKQPINKTTLQSQKNADQSIKGVTSEQRLRLINLIFSQTSIPTLNSAEIYLYHFYGYWSIDNLKVSSLTDINVHFKKGLFYGICRIVGSGKSGLIGAILNEIPYYHGVFVKNGTIAYVEQEPVLFSATIKENIVFGRPFDKQKYDNAIQDSCFSADLKLLYNGDETVVGQKKP